MPRKGPDAGIRERRDSLGNITYEVSFYHKLIGRKYDSFRSENGPKPGPKAKQACRDWRAKWQVKIMHGKLGIETKSGPVSFEVAMEEFLAAIEPHRRKATVDKHYRATLTQVWLPLFKGRPLASIREQELQALFTARAKAGDCRRSIDIYRQVLGRLFRWAMRPQGPEGVPYVTSSPTDGDFLLPEAKDPAPKRFLRLQELQAVLRKVAPEHRLLFGVLAYLGPRRSELYRIEWSWVDWDAAILSYPVKGGKRGAGDVPIPPFLLDELRAEYEARKATAKAEGRDLCPFLFSPDGEPVDHRKTIVATCKAAGISPKGVGYHCFRHTLGTLLYRHVTNKDRIVSQRMLRHRKKKTDSTELYLHADLELDVRPALNKLVEMVETAPVALEIPRAA